MSCCSAPCPAAPGRRYRTVLWAVLWMNALMFVVETVMGVRAGSVSLLSDSLDFFGDAANYGISLWVLDKTLRHRARASLLKAGCMAVFGIWVLAAAAYRYLQGGLPAAPEMGAVGLLALAVNLSAAVLLSAYRDGDSNMRGVWLCSRNDAAGNLLVVVAAAAVWFTQSNLPDLLAATLLALLSLQASRQIIRQARQELQAV